MLIKVIIVSPENLGLKRNMFTLVVQAMLTSRRSLTTTTTTSIITSCKHFVKQKIAPAPSQWPCYGSNYMFAFPRWNCSWWTHLVLNLDFLFLNWFLPQANYPCLHFLNPLLENGSKFTSFSRKLVQIELITIWSVFELVSIIPLCLIFTITPPVFRSLFFTST